MVVMEPSNIGAVALFKINVGTKKEIVIVTKTVLDISCAGQAIACLLLSQLLTAASTHYQVCKNNLSPKMGI